MKSKFLFGIFVIFLSVLSAEADLYNPNANYVPGATTTINQPGASATSGATIYPKGTYGYYYQQKYANKAVQNVNNYQQAQYQQPATQYAQTQYNQSQYAQQQYQQQEQYSQPTQYSQASQSSGGANYSYTGGNTTNDPVNTVNDTLNTVNSTVNSTLNLINTFRYGY